MIKNQDCYLHKGRDSKVFMYESEDYEAAIKDGWVSSIAEAKLQSKKGLAKSLMDKSKEKEPSEESLFDEPIGEPDEEAIQVSTEKLLVDMNLKELRAVAKGLNICCVSKSKADEIIKKILEATGETSED